MASQYGNARYKPLSTTQTQLKMKRHDIVCLHTMVGSLTSTNSYFRNHGFGGTESHYGVGGKWGADAGHDLDGQVYQWQDRAYTADANLDGNGRIISIETADNAPQASADILPWTSKQAAAIVDLVAWECSLAAHADCPAAWSCHKGVMWRGVRVAIPPVLVPDSKPTRRGLAVHRQGVEPSAGVGKLTGYLVVGGERWSTAKGKECPGDARTKQFENDIIPAVQAKILHAANPQEETVAELTPAQLKTAIVDVLTNAKIVPNVPTEAQLKDDPTLKTTYFTVVGVLANLEKTQDLQDENTARTTADVKAMLGELMAKLGAALPEGVKL